MKEKIQCLVCGKLKQADRTSDNKCYNCCIKQLQANSQRSDIPTPKKLLEQADKDLDEATQKQKRQSPASPEKFHKFDENKVYRRDNSFKIESAQESLRKGYDRKPIQNICEEKFQKSRNKDIKSRDTKSDYPESKDSHDIRGVAPYISLQNRLEAMRKQKGLTNPIKSKANLQDRRTMKYQQQYQPRRGDEFIKKERDKTQERLKQKDEHSEQNYRYRSGAQQSFERQFIEERRYQRPRQTDKRNYQKQYEKNHYDRRPMDKVFDKGASQKQQKKYDSSYDAKAFEKYQEKPYQNKKKNDISHYERPYQSGDRDKSQEKNYQRNQRNQRVQRGQRAQKYEKYDKYQRIGQRTGNRQSLSNRAFQFDNKHDQSYRRKYSGSNLEFSAKVANVQAKYAAYDAKYKYEKPKENSIRRPSTEKASLARCRSYRSSLGMGPGLTQKERSDSQSSKYLKTQIQMPVSSVAPPKKYQNSFIDSIRKELDEMKKQLREVTCRESARVFRFCGMCGRQGQFIGGLCQDCK